MTEDLKRLLQSPILRHYSEQIIGELLALVGGPGWARRSEFTKRLHLWAALTKEHLDGVEASWRINSDQPLTFKQVERELRSIERLSSELSGALAALTDEPRLMLWREATKQSTGPQISKASEIPVGVTRLVELTEAVQSVVPIASRARLAATSRIRGPQSPEVWVRRGAVGGLLELLEWLTGRPPKRRNLQDLRDGRTGIRAYGPVLEFVHTAIRPLFPSATKQALDNDIRLWQRAYGKERG